jgi:hypothetical protein
LPWPRSERPRHASAALPACLYAAGDSAVGFYGYGSLAGTAGGLASLASLEAAGDLSGDAMH